MAIIGKYHGRELVLENLRNQSGTTRKGTTMLGLYQSAAQFGFDAKGYESDLESLKASSHPVILHVVKDKHLQHYIVLFGHEKGKYIVADPAEGICIYDEKMLLDCWQSRTLLTMEPGDGFEQEKPKKNARLQWIIDLVKEDMSLLTVVAIIGLCITSLGLSTAMYSQKLIDEILPDKDLSKLVLGMSLLTVLLLFRGFLQFIRGSMLIRQSKDFNVRIIDKFYAMLLQLPKSFFDHRKTGDLIARMNDTARIQRTVSLIVGSIMIDVLLVLVSCIFMFYYDVWLGVAVLVALIFYSLLALKYGKKLLFSQQEVMKAYSSNESNYVDTIQGIEAIKSSGREGIFSKITSAIYGNFQEKAFMLGKVGLRYGLVNELSGTLFSMALIAYLSFSVVQGELLVGEMVALLSVSSGIIPSVIKIFMANIQLKEAEVAFNRMYEFAELDAENSDPQENKENQITDRFERFSLNGLSFSFPGTSRLLEGISLEVKKGELVALLGESGGGKSTLFQLVQRFYQATEGTIIYNDKDISEIPLQTWRTQIGVVPQGVKLFNGSVLDNIAMGDYHNDPEQFIKDCAELGLDPFINALPNGYLTIVGEEGVNLSGGQRQLVALARALVNRPKLLLLDEAFSAMGRDMRGFAHELIFRVKKNTGIIMATHDIGTAIKADRVYILEDGTITDSGTPHQLLEKENVLSFEYKEMVSLD
jgi:ATP-binding cassette subfamily B protein